MKRVVAVGVAVVVVALVAGVAMAQGPGWGGGMMGWGSGAGWGGGYGPGWMHQRMWGGQGGGPGYGGCPGWAAATGQGAAAPGEAVTEDKARELATEYASKYFKGYTVERVLPFQGRFQTSYQVELKGPKGESRILHVMPWGGVRPFGPPA